MATRDEVIAIVTEQLNKTPEEAKDSARFIEELNADSLDIVEISMQIQDKCGVEIPDTEIRKMTMVGDLVKYVEERAAK